MIHCCVCNESACGEHPKGSLTWCATHQTGRILLGIAPKAIKRATAVPVWAPGQMLPSGGPAMSVQEAQQVVPAIKVGTSITPNEAVKVLAQQQQAMSVAGARAQQQALDAFKQQVGYYGSMTNQGFGINLTASGGWNTFSHFGSHFGSGYGRYR